MEIQTLGRHILVEYYDGDKEIFSSPEKIEKIMNEAAKKANATVVESVFHHFNPYGVSGAVVIKESHLTIHTWPEYGYAAVDIFTCGDSVNPWDAFKYLEKQFKAKKYETSEIPRGITEKIKKYSNENFNITTHKLDN